MQTFRKLPKTRPNTNAAAVKMVLGSKVVSVSAGLSGDYSCGRRGYDVPVGQEGKPARLPSCSASLASLNFFKMRASVPALPSRIAKEDLGGRERSDFRAVRRSS